MNAWILVLIGLAGYVLGGLTTAWVLSLAVVLRAQAKDRR